jgi:MscS family membrane protein
MAELWVGAGIILTGIVAALITYQLFKWLQRKADATDSKIDDIVILAIGKPLVLGIILLSLFLALNVVVLPPDYQWIKDSKYLVAIYIFLGAWIISVFTKNFVKLYGRWMAQKTESEFDDKIIDIVEIIARYVIWFIAFLLVLSYLEVDITPLIAGAGIFGIAVALAAQDLLSNFFGGALILLDRPFKVGDRIKIEGHLGDVISVGPRSTRIKTLDYQLLTIPNSKLTNSIITNYAMPDIKLKVKIPVSVAYGSDIKQVKEVLLEIARDAALTTPYILQDPAPSVYFLEYGASSLDFMMVMWAREFHMAWDIKDHINFTIYDRFEKEGIEIPFPQMDVHMRD